MADLGKLQTDVYVSEKDARWIAESFRQLAPRVRNIGGLIFAGKVQWIRPTSNNVFQAIDVDPDFALNAFFPVARGYKARHEGIGYTLKLGVWDQGEKRRIVIASQASRQSERPQASAARKKLVGMLAQADDTFKPVPVAEHS
ncbi:MAG: hypothetical protein ACRDOK_08455 [Streptosporangiaceae bacterium]